MPTTWRPSLPLTGSPVREENGEAAVSRQQTPWCFDSYARFTRFPFLRRPSREWHRARHEDLAGKSRFELLRDRDRLRLRLLLDEDPEPWLLERWHAVAEAVARAR